MFVVADPGFVPDGFDHVVVPHGSPIALPEVLPAPHLDNTVTSAPPEHGVTTTRIHGRCPVAASVSNAANGSPTAVSRRSMSPAPTTRQRGSSAVTECSTSAHLSGAATEGTRSPRKEYGATVDLPASFWLQSTNTFPGRSRLLIRAVMVVGSSAASVSATARANALESSYVAVPSSGATTCRPFWPENLTYGASPASRSRTRRRSASAAASTTPAGGPGSRSKTTSRGRSSALVRARNGCSSIAERFAAHTSEATSSMTAASKLLPVRG